ncbi:MAG: hypothetical protein ILO68_07390 [Clostridia bacterium]|nr:hypothetical protein [Clostridia bacterium]
MRVFSKRNPALILLCFLFAILIPLAEGCGGPGPQNPSEETSPDVSETNESESESSEETAVYSVNYSGTSYPLSAVNRDTGGQGLFYFDRSTGATSAPEREPEADPYTDIAVCNGIVCAVFINQPAVLPESGFVLRASGTELKRDPVPGITVRSSLDSGRYLP